MDTRKSIVAAILISAAIRIAILHQTSGVTYAGYEDLTQIKHIVETGLPLTTDASAWGGAIYNTLPLYHYLAAFTSILLPIPHAALLVSNAAALAIPLAVYGLAKEVTTQYRAPDILALASAFTPLLYRETVITADPIALALPLFFGAYYYFLRLGKTPKDQALFLILTIALTATHPISILFVIAMLVTLLLKRIQAIEFSQPMAEAAFSATFFVTWANLLIYKETLQTHGISALTQAQGALSIPYAATNIGLLVLLAGTYATARYLAAEQNQSAHALAALALTTAALTLLRLLPQTTGLLLISITLLPLSAGAIQDYQNSRHRSRAPNLYSFGAVLLAALFLTTNAAPAIALGYEQLANTPSQQEHELMHELARTPRAVTYWDATHGDFLRYHGFGTPTTQNTRVSADTQQITHDLAELQTANNPVRYIELLNKHDIELLILENSTQTPITERCFTQLETTNYEVYKLRCVIT